MRDIFITKFKVPLVIVSHPNQSDFFNKKSDSSSASNKLYRAHDGKIILLYPALPRVFKNFEVLCEAMKLVSDKARKKIEIYITISGDENLYSKFIFHRYRSVEGIRFIGHQAPDQMVKYFQRCDVVVFPSRLETWGLPISEAKAMCKPLLVSDLPYAHETVGKYDAAYFLPPRELHGASYWKFQYLRYLGRNL
jgi:glycosyltransferase involved in cell wall biosynthesis